LSRYDLTDIFVAEHLESFERKKIAAFSAEKLPEHVFSPDFERKMARLIRQANRHYITILGIRMRRLVAICALLAILLTGCVAVRMIGNILIERHKEYSRFTFLVITEEMKQQKFVFITPETPEGFTVTQSEQLHAMQVIDYEDGEGNSFTYFQADIRGLASYVDTEGVKTYPIEINGHKGITHTKDGYHYIMWVDGINSFEFSGECDFEFLKSMAEGLK